MDVSTISSDLKDDILREQVRLSAQQLPTMQAGSLAVALVLAFTVRHTASGAAILFWLGLVLAVAVSRTLFHYRFLKVRSIAFNGDAWKDAYLLLALMSGIVWGLSAFLIFPAGNMELVSIFVLVIATLSAATTVSHSAIRLGPAVWAGPAMLLYAIRCVTEGSEPMNTLALLIVIYLFIILKYSFKHNSAILASLALKFENLELLNEVQRMNAALRLTSAQDGLTGLANRRSFDEVLEREWRRAMRDAKPLSLIMLDLDAFKPYNDNYGHLEGDICLRRVTDVISRSIKRPADHAARYGGDEIVIILPDTSLPGAVDIAEKLRSSVEGLSIPHAHSPTADVVTVSIGVAFMIPHSGMRPAQLVKQVDAALYAAKNEGRNRVRTA